MPSCSIKIISKTGKAATQFSLQLLWREATQQVRELQGAALETPVPGLPGTVSKPVGGKHILRVWWAVK